MTRLRFLLLPAILLALSLATSAQATKTLTPSEAKDHVGEKATVCGKAVGTHYAASSRGSPTFLNLDKPYPNQIFTIVIWGSDRAKFGAPEQTYQGRQVCVTGPITSFRGVPEIIAHIPEQIKVKE